MKSSTLLLSLLLLTGCAGSGIRPDVPFYDGVWSGTWTSQTSGAGSGRASMSFRADGTCSGQFEGDSLIDGTFVGTPDVQCQCHFVDYPGDWVSVHLVKAGDTLTGSASFRNLRWSVRLSK